MSVAPPATATLPPGMTTARLPAPILNGVGALLLLALSAWLWTGAAGIEGADGSLEAPDGFPRLVSALLALSCLLLLIQSARGVLSRSAAVISIPRPAPVVMALVLVCLYPLLIEVAGYYVATAIWMVPFLLVAGMRNALGIFASVAGFLIFTKVLFQLVLGTPLP
jgi:hypothetical protein